jgi:hypothetical protein
MKSFKQFIVEAKNTHMTHMEDVVLYGGTKGIQDAFFVLQELTKFFNSDASGNAGLTVKWDGAPAVFAGIDPSDGKFFVSKKGIFNKNPKVYKSIADVKADTSGDLQTKMIESFKHLSKLGITDVLQGDLMFTKSDIKTEKFGEEKFYTFQPNTIVYAVPVDSDLGKEIKEAKLGIVFHTSYKGSSFESMSSNFNIDLSDMIKTKDVWYQDATYKNVSKLFELSSKEKKEINSAIKTAQASFKKINTSIIDHLFKNPDLAQKIEQFNNSLVRKGEVISNEKKHVQALIKWYEDKFAQEEEKRKSEKGKANVRAKRDQELSFFSPSNKAKLAELFKLQNELVGVKKLLINKLDKISDFRTFVRTSSGLKVTGSEGFVAINNKTGDAVKLVDRMEFSKNNFSDEIIKGWMK